MTSLKETRPDITQEKKFFRPWQNRWWIGAIIACLIVVGAVTFFSKGRQNASRAAQQGHMAAPAIPIAAAAVKKGDLNVYLTGLGTVTSLNTVTVNSRVDGELTNVLFREGQSVSKGELLAEIDPRPYEAMLTQAEGALARDQALLENAKLDLTRYQDLVKKDLIATQQRDTQAALVHQYEGSVKNDQGQIDNAKLQLVYAHITAPISGRIGLRLVDPGNIVHATDSSGVVVITQMQPISVIFSLPEDNLSQVLGKLRSGAPLTVEAYDRDQKQKLATGNLLTVNNQIDPSTGTIKLKALFPNRNDELFPNQFVNARLIIEVKHNALMVSPEAIQRGPQGTFVYVVKADQTAALRPITVGLVQEGTALITSGLSAGELVVVDGADRLRDGSKVEVSAPNSGEPVPQRHNK
ncbi:MAG TPA: MdtA/MuxA family multidrug efflux RND transporter periplasmic adaptor subunit [Nitrospirota bacterium]|nr:MdtA/MuxA family multidrug efflux RND transporter periplasmic adaptor subunit [Nitrospirota bacterium]